MKNMEYQYVENFASSTLFILPSFITSFESEIMVTVIGICGGSGGGKSTLSKAVADELTSDTCCVLIHDSYYKDISHLTLEERAKTNFDHPSSLDTSLLIQHVRDLKQGKKVEVPNYDFSTHMRTNVTTTVQPKPVVIVEGILIFSDPDLVKELDVKVFVDADSDVRLIRRLKRDMKERGRTVEQVIDQYQTTVKPMHEMFVEPSKNVADIVIMSDKCNDPKVSLSVIVNHLKSISNGNRFTK